MEDYTRTNLENLIISIEGGDAYQAKQAMRQLIQTLGGRSDMLDTGAPPELMMCYTLALVLARAG